MYDVILVPTDGSQCANRAVASAVSLADRFDASVNALFVLDLTEIPASVERESRDLISKRGESALSSAKSNAEDYGIEMDTKIAGTTGRIHRAIIDEATTQDADLIAMGSHGRTGLERLVLGSIAERTIRESPIPVLTVKNQSVGAEIDRVLVPTDGSDGAALAAEHAIQLAAETGATLHVVNVVDVSRFGGEIATASIYEEFEAIGRSAVNDVIERAENAGLGGIEASVLSGSPGRSLVEYVTQRDIDLVVMGTHGRSGLDRYLLGSVAETVARSAESPVITVNASASSRE